MSVCPWCKASNPPRAEACLKCGKRAADHPSIATGQLDTGFDDPDEGAAAPTLNLDLSAKRVPQGVVPMRTIGADVFEDEESGEAAPKLNLDIIAIPKPVDGAPSAASSGGGPVVPKGAEPQQSKGATAQDAARPGATLEIDAYEVRALADYGEPPHGIVQAVPYAIRVTLRRRELRRALATVRTALTEAERRRDDRLVELGQQMRPVIEGNPELEQAAAPLAVAEKTKQAREAALQSASGEFRERVAGIDRDIAAQDEPLARWAKDTQERQKAWEAADELRKRHEARSKRVAIELRNAQAKLERPETAPADRQQAQAFIQAAQGERATRAAEEKLATDQAKEAETKLALSRRGLADVEATIAALRKRRRAIEDEFARQGAVRAEGIDAASREVRGALLEIGRKVVRDGIDAAAPGVPAAIPGLLGQLRDAEAHSKRLQYDLEKHLRALDAADDAAVKKGRVLLIAAVVLLLGSFIAWRALRSNPYMEQMPQAPAASASAVK